MKRNTIKFMVLLPVLACLLALIVAGCAQFSSTQKETHADGTSITSRQRVLTFWDSQSSIAKLRVSRTDKTQGLTLGGFSEASEASNVVSIVGAVTEGAVKGAVQAVAPK